MEEEGEEKVGKGVRRRCSSLPPLLHFVVQSLDLAAVPRRLIWEGGRVRRWPFLLLLLVRSSVVVAPRRSLLLPIGFAIFLVYLVTIPITGIGINPARNLGAAIIFNRDHAWSDQKKEKERGKGRKMGRNCQT
ncbi:hypothetical protein Ahy_A05g022178 [Arachis hypogaea]|uniref:Aquaporin n=1 Tax=Arachis hypogaea TaxID=3818 RepID=A0A445CZZ1_ARAHY|nr:hypothetical protein Ahy_A05g022178 [Arachis hypogaea]